MQMYFKLIIHSSFYCVTHLSVEGRHVSRDQQVETALGRIFSFVNLLNTKLYQNTLRAEASSATYEQKIDFQEFAGSRSGKARGCLSFNMVSKIVLFLNCSFS